MMNLNISYELIKHPYENEAGSQGEVWSKIELKIIGNNSQIVKMILNIQWDIKVFLEWFVENESLLFVEEPPEEIKHSSISQGIYFFYQNLNNEIDDDDLLGVIYNYRSRHGLRFALRGTDIEDIYIGMNDGIPTISLYNDNSQWNYEFNKDEFMNEIHNIVSRVMP
jgi:hypothetical protein